jgi:putative chitinase
MATTLILIQKLSKPGAKIATLTEIAKWFDFYKYQFGVTSVLRQSAFLAQAAHETDGFRSLKEYDSGAKYEGRKDLGNTTKGDGVKYKGRGIFMTTGRLNYANYSKRIFGDTRLLSQPQVLEQPQYAVYSAFLYWNDRKLNQLADEGDTPAITRKINGGKNGLAEREHFYDMAMAFISGNPLTAVLVVVIGIGLLYYLTNK